MLQQSENEERNIEYNLLSINIAINALVWGGAGPPIAWSVAFETSVLPSMFSGVPVQCTTKANIPISNDGDSIRKFKI